MAQSRHRPMHIEGHGLMWGGRFGILGVLLALAALAAAAFGAVHNQLSFSVGADYFTEIKFPQFGIEGLPARLGAAWVGVAASWWMGPIAGAPAFLFGLSAVARRDLYLAAGIGAIGLAILAATLAALLGLVAGIVLETHPLTADFPVPEGADRGQILRAGLMHQGAYLGGALGALLAFWPMWRARRAGRRRHMADAA